MSRAWKVLRRTRRPSGRFDRTVAVKSATAAKPHRRSGKIYSVRFGRPHASLESRARGSRVVEILRHSSRAERGRRGAGRVVDEDDLGWSWALMGLDRPN